MSKKKNPGPATPGQTPTPAGPKLSKREQLRAERHRRTQMWNFIFIGGGLVIVALVAWYFMANARPGPLTGEQIMTDYGGGHVEDGLALTYPNYPPSSGQHYNAPAPWGVYTNADPISVASGGSIEGVFVHNLEHGGVVFLYACPDACPELEQQFQDLYKQVPPGQQGTQKMLATPYDAAKMNGSSIIALAWAYQLNMSGFDETTLLTWYKRFVDYVGPERTVR